MLWSVIISTSPDAGWQCLCHLNLLHYQHCILQLSGTLCQWTGLLYLYFSLIPEHLIVALQPCFYQDLGRFYQPLVIFYYDDHRMMLK